MPARLTDAEVVGFCGLLGSAGSETVTRLLANAVVLFQRFPDQHRIVQEEPGRILDAVEEVLGTGRPPRSRPAPPTVTWSATAG